jgi:hypothetical protein
MTNPFNNEDQQSEEPQNPMGSAAKNMALQSLEQRIAPGTIRAATPQEELAARCLWPVVTLEELPKQIAKHPESSILVETTKSIQRVCATLQEYGARSRVKVLVAMPLVKAN